MAQNDDPGQHPKTEYRREATHPIKRSDGVRILSLCILSRSLFVIFPSSIGAQH